MEQPTKRPYLSVIYHLAIAFWVGGAALFTFILTPAIFRDFDRDTAGTVVGILFPGYFRWGLACGVVALVCLLLSQRPRKIVSTIILLVMLIITSLQAFVIEPKAAALKKEMAALKKGSPAMDVSEMDRPLRQEFKVLHTISAGGNLSVIGAGIVLIFLL
jgi:uncharacterized membrane protein